MTKRDAALRRLTPADRSRFARIAGSSTGGCAEWPKTCSRNGYGVFQAQGVALAAHRVAYFLATGDAPRVVRHTCDNPPCVCVSHLRGGTQSANMLDAAAKGRAVRGERNHNARLRDEDVRAIRASSRAQTALARDYGVTRQAIHRIVRGPGWAHV